MANVPPGVWGACVRCYSAVSKAVITPRLDSTCLNTHTHTYRIFFNLCLNNWRLSLSYGGRYGVKLWRLSAASLVLHTVVSFMAQILLVFSLVKPIRYFIQHQYDTIWWIHPSVREAFPSCCHQGVSDKQKQVGRFRLSHLPGLEI